MSSSRLRAVLEKVSGTLEASDNILKNCYWGIRFPFLEKQNRRKIGGGGVFAERCSDGVALSERRQRMADLSG